MTANPIDQCAREAKYIKVSFKLTEPPLKVVIKYTPFVIGWDVGERDRHGDIVRSGALLQTSLDYIKSHYKGRLRPETVEVIAVKSPLPSKKLLPIALQACCDTWGVGVPNVEQLKEGRALFKAEKAAEKEARSEGVVIAPTPGTFYRTAWAGGERLVDSGQSVRKGQELGSILSNVSFHPVKTHRAGRVAQISAEEGQLVEYGDRLFKIE